MRGAKRQAAVLLVEDDDDIREILGTVLREEGYRVLEAGNGREALGFLRGGERIGLILLDLLMPVMNGWELLAEQQADEGLRGIPVVTMTAGGEAARASPQTECLMKPISLDRVLDAVRRNYRG
ncbi:MAG: response regulator [Planctomycetes bacterium]|nr:response regulator [Planctomycetota bacterium]